ncbi:MAG: hypothetical protein HY549_07675 [Elusimicrobia bacterium]|nr:hypothetical protein [Elusimicrobiota bacterium]
MRSSLFAIALLFGASSGRSSLDYVRYSDPARRYSIEHPSNWKRSDGLGLIDIRPPQRISGARITLERLPVGQDAPSTKEQFVERLLEPIGTVKSLKKRKHVMVGGRKALLLELIETERLRGEHGEWLPGPLEETFLIVDAGRDYYVLSLSGVGESVRQARPEFEKVASSFKLLP